MKVKKDSSDFDLLLLMRDEDSNAFAVIYRRYWERLFETAVKALRDAEQAEDVVQDVFFSLWNRRKTLNLEGSLAAYLQTSIRYKCIDYIEKNITRRDYLGMLTQVETESLSLSPDMQLQLKDVQGVIDKTLAGMSPKVRQAYHLSRNEHLTHKEIAEKMNISTETVKKHIQIALRLLKSALGSDVVNVSLLVYLLNQHKPLFMPH